MSHRKSFILMKVFHGLPRIFWGYREHCCKNKEQQQQKFCKTCVSFSCQITLQCSRPTGSLVKKFEHVKFELLEASWTNSAPVLREVRPVQSHQYVGGTCCLHLEIRASYPEDLDRGYMLGTATRLGARRAGVQPFISKHVQANSRAHPALL